MNILLVNDDGIKAQGLRILAETLSADHNIYIVAPDSERSAASHSYSFSKPLKIDEYEDGGKVLGDAIDTLLGCATEYEKIMEENEILKAKNSELEKAYESLWNEILC